MDEDILALASAGRKIEAIKLYRERYGVGLAAAKDAVEEMGAGRGVRLVQPQPFSYAQVDEGAFNQQIEALIRVNNRIEAIKRYRERYGVGLKEAKDAIDAWGTAPGGAPAAPPAQSLSSSSPSAGDFVFSPRSPLPISPVPPAPGSPTAPPSPAAPTVFSAAPPTPPTATPRPAPAQPAASAASAASQAETARMDRNLGQGIDLALQTGRRDEAIELYQTRYKVSRQEAERVIDGRASQIHAGSGARSGCFIATAAYGDADTPEVRVLRRYRDEVLSRSSAGRACIRAYYRLSPGLAASVGASATGRQLVRRALAPVVRRCRRALEPGDGSR